MLLFKYQQINENCDNTFVGLFHEFHVKMQNSLVAYCKKKSREWHRVKNEEVKCQTAKRIGKKNELRERQQQKLLDSFKYASWLNQQFYPPRFWNTPKKAMDDFEKIIAQSNKKKCVKE